MYAQCELYVWHHAVFAVNVWCACLVVCSDRDVCSTVRQAGVGFFFVLSGMVKIVTTREGMVFHDYQVMCMCIYYYMQPANKGYFTTWSIYSFLSSDIFSVTR